MKELALKIALSAFLAAAPLGVAFAEEFSADIDDATTASIAPEASRPMTRIQEINARIAAAETNLQPAEHDSYVDEAAAAQAQADLISIRQAAADSERADGGQLGAKAYRSLTDRLRGVQQLIYQAQNG